MCNLDINDPNKLFRCRRCGEYKPNSEFNQSHTANLRKYVARCKKCLGELEKLNGHKRTEEGKLNQLRYSNKRYHQNKDKWKVYQAAHKANKPFEFMFKTCRGNARRRGFKVQVDVDFIKSIWNEQNGKCYYTGDEMTQQLGNENSMSIDRVNSNKDYTKDNVVLCCYRVNVCKNNLNREEFISMSQKVINKFSS